MEELNKLGVIEEMLKHKLVFIETRNQ